MARLRLADLGTHLSGIGRDMPAKKHEALTKVAEFVVRDAKERFGRYQKGWPQLADSTTANRVAKGYSADEPLLRSGELRDSIGHTVDDKAHVGTSDPRMKFFEYGTSRMPARPVLGTVLAEKGQEIADIAGAEMFAERHIRKRV